VFNSCSPSRCLPASPSSGKVIHLSLAVVLALFLAARSDAQMSTCQWDEVVGKDVRNNKGQLLGVIKDTVVDLENGR